MAPKCWMIDGVSVPSSGLMQNWNCQQEPPGTRVWESRGLEGNTSISLAVTKAMARPLEWGNVECRFSSLSWFYRHDRGIGSDLTTTTTTTKSPLNFFWDVGVVCWKECYLSGFLISDIIDILGSIILCCIPPSPSP